MIFFANFLLGTFLQHETGTTPCNHRKRQQNSRKSDKLRFIFIEACKPLSMTQFAFTYLSYLFLCLQISYFFYHFPFLFPFIGTYISSSFCPHIVPIAEIFLSRAFFKYLPASVSDWTTAANLSLITDWLDFDSAAVVRRRADARWPPI